jgi:hypothetical protein
MQNACLHPVARALQSARNVSAAGLRTTAFTNGRLTRRCPDALPAPISREPVTTSLSPSRMRRARRRRTIALLGPTCPNSRAHWRHSASWPRRPRPPPATALRPERHYCARLRRCRDCPSDTGSESVGDAAAALPLAAFGRLASTRRIELSRGVLAVALLAFRAKRLSGIPDNCCYPDLPVMPIGWPLMVVFPA